MEGLVTCAVMSMAGHTLTGFHFRTGEQRGSLATQRSSRSSCCQHVAALQLQEPPGLQTAASTPTRQDTLGLPYMSLCSALYPAHSSTQDAIGSARHHVSLAAII